MKYEIETKNKEIVLIVESFLTGSKSLYVNSVKADKVNKTTYSLDGKNYQLNGNSFSGLTLYVDNERYTVSEATAWYEYIFAALVFIFDMIWGNIPATVSIFPIVAGFIGGAICGVATVINIIAMKSIRNFVIKIVVVLLISVIAILICNLIALAILELI